MKRLFACLIAIFGLCFLNPMGAMAARWGGYYLYNGDYGHCGDDRLSPDIRIQECLHAARQYRLKSRYALDLYDMLAAAFIDKSDYPHAIEVYNTAVQIGDETDQKYIQRFLRGEALLKSGARDAAFQEFSAFQSETGDKNPYADDGLGQVAADKGNFDEAIVLLTKAVSMDNAKYDVLSDRADIYRKMGDYEKALKDDTEIAKDNPFESWPHNNLCYDRAIQNTELDLALADCNRAIDLLPDEPYYLDSLGLVRFRQGKWEDAMTAYNAALSHNPYLATSLFMRGIVELKKGDATKGNTDIDAARALDPHIGIYFATYGIVP